MKEILILLGLLIFSTLMMRGLDSIIGMAIKEQ